MLLLAIAAGAVQLAEIADIEIGDSKGTAAVVLKNLVGGALRAASNDLRGAGGLLDGECI